ncbi:MAG: DUF4214 domain-containing protein [Clostridiales bacterium]|nr:DUF4214 domain-containing protein [Clostridiales bacterium]
MKKIFCARIICSILATSFISASCLIPQNNVRADENSMDDDTCEFYLEEDAPHVAGQLIVCTKDFDLEGESSIEDSLFSIEKLGETSEDTTYLVEYNQSMDQDEIIALFSSLQNIEYVQYNYIYELEDTLIQDTIADPYLDGYQIQQTNAEFAWSLMDIRGYQKVRVGVIDTGVDYTHPELAGVVNKELSYDVCYEETLSPISFGDHGTLVAGVIAAHNSGYDDPCRGIASGNNNDIVELVSYAVYELPNDFTCSVFLVRAMERAIADKCQVINMSLGDYHYDSYLHKSICRAYDLGIVLVGGAGNDNTTKFNMPSDLPEVISVIALDYVDDPKLNRKADFSNYGPLKDIAAPGRYITSCAMNGSYMCAGGTSLSAPIVSGVAALILAVNPSLPPIDVKNLMQDRALDLYTPGFDDYTAYGQVDAYASVQFAFRMDPGLRKSLSEQFIWRLYDIILDRQPDEDGQAYWQEKIENGLTGSEIVRYFCLSEELLNMDLDDQNYVAILYRAIFDRTPDDEGFRHWYCFLCAGGSKESLVAHFINSPEFADLCDYYGIPIGYISFPDPVEKYPSTMIFVDSVYYHMFFRETERTAMDYWCTKLNSGEITAGEFMFYMFNSDEFISMKKEDWEYVYTLYLAFFSRCPNDEEIDYWVDFLEYGVPRNDLILMFIYSKEFGDICQNYGLVR